MAIELIDKIKQKNSGSFKLVDAADVDWDGTGTKSVKERIEEMETEAGNVESMTNAEIDNIFKED